VLDDQLENDLILRGIERWYKGRVIMLGSLRPRGVVKDDAVPTLLRRVKGPTFVTINYTDFWKVIRPSRDYCVICLKLPQERAREVPDALRAALKEPPWRTKRGRMGAVIGVTDRTISHYQA
jgi:hypothetical protein